MHTHCAAAHSCLGKGPAGFQPARWDGLGGSSCRPTAPSGAENQDNFIVIISLPLSPSLHRRRRRRRAQGRGSVWQREKDRRGRNKNTKEKMFGSCLVNCRIYGCVSQCVSVSVCPMLILLYWLGFTFLIFIYCHFSQTTKSSHAYTVLTRLWDEILASFNVTVLSYKLSYENSPALKQCPIYCGKSTDLHVNSFYLNWN